MKQFGRMRGRMSRFGKRSQDMDGDGNISMGAMSGGPRTPASQKAKKNKRKQQKANRKKNRKKR
ncbi:hypothetical protein BVY04_00665 [bacterium M21]|nr:hypothetical protein BVY04_00665 [bacterium M21]